MISNKQRIEQVISDQLKDHRIKFIGSHNGFEEIQLKNPNNGFYWMGYLYRKGLLFVWGDSGDAVYQWHHSIGTFKDVSECSLDYFASKCVASPLGRGFKSWNYEKAEERLKEVRFEAIGFDERAILANGIDQCGSQFEFNMWLNYEGYKVCDPCDWSEIGMEIDIQCVLHLAGLKIAFKDNK